MILKVFLIVLLANLFSCQKGPKARLSFLHKPKNGGKTAVACLVDTGEAPFDFNWYKDDQLITNEASFRIDKLGDSSILKIEPMKSDLNGKYSCSVKNLFGIDSPSIEIAVEGSPSWRFQQPNIKAKNKETVSLKCSASGYPLPKVIWKRFDGSNWIPLGDDQSIFRVSHDEFKIESINKNFQGKYGCEISNGFEPNLWNEFIIDIIGKILREMVCTLVIQRSRFNFVNET
ncbi:cell adhesion molecule DSCAM-like isoform X2 [Panonychus citri]|uniref:cell adhesion molecule DSCAM-like isoform X2 n=1 Tax=Panonychus citri TaxID=50023 RepID=UPI002306FB30|nr:cell adhesion molecule DSCAM-like isoform X2 [Panonychus citri]XP_053212515.1 cell adhesion molecule DSCAM-like isoform X2 [Panonychus citri]